ncbi:hypothetical protein WP7S18E06_37220 [Aeromonas hydrophila]|nr:hypothetical protein WP7S18E06_37220 [Aeromonas hydrophila]
MGENLLIAGMFDFAFGFLVVFRSKKRFSINCYGI